MAQALAAGWTGSGPVSATLVPAERIAAYDPFATATERFRERVGESVQLLDSEAAVAEAADVLFIAVKQAYVQQALEAASSKLTADTVVVSIAAGTTLSQLESWVPNGVPVIRVMPNTPCLVGKGVCCYALGKNASAEQAETVHSLLSAVGLAVKTTEQQLDAVTGLSGSGPAFVYTVIEAMADGGVRAGLPRELAAELAARTVAGAAEMVLATGQHPAALRDAVASPAGTTIAGLGELERRGIRAALSEAVIVAATRAAEMGK